MNGPVYNVAFAAAAACASGMTEAFQALGKKTHVIVYAGDGGTLDIGIQSMSGAFERGTDFLYLLRQRGLWEYRYAALGRDPAWRKDHNHPDREDRGEERYRRDCSRPPPRIHGDRMQRVPAGYLQKSCKGAHVPRPDVHPYPCSLPARLAVPDREDDRDRKTRGQIRDVGALRARARETDPQPPL